MLKTFARAAAIAAALACATAALAQKSFVRDDLASEGVRLEEKLRTEAGSTAAGRPAAQLRRDAEGLMSRSNQRGAMSLYAAAVALEPKNAANWVGFAKAVKAITPKDYTERYQLRERGTAAAYIAYQRATTRPAEAEALGLLGDLHVMAEDWRPALNAYAASLQLADEPALRKTYEELREKRGFRITNYKVDSDSASPRVCFNFSEPLAQGRVDFGPFVAVSGAANAAITTESSQLCVDGLKHGERYAFVLRQGLPSSVGESLLKAADYEVYVRDRSPQVRFTGRNYVLPRTGQEGIPLVSVNTAGAEVEIYRIGDRNLLPTVRSEEFLGQINRSAAETIATEKGRKIWSGSLETKSELNRDVVTAFPVTEAVGKLEPGVYVMISRPKGAAPAEEDYSARATQWFVVSNLGLTGFKGKDGVHALVRSLATAEPLANVEIRLVARNNDVLATKSTDAAGHVAFDPGLARGEGGNAPGLIVASTGEDYGFLDLGSSAFDLTDRGVKGRVAPGAVDAYVFAERGVYRSGETVFVTALLRDAKGAAISGLPLTLVAKRPDGVEYRRAQVEDQGLGGRAFSLPLLPGAMHGTWRVSAYTDPKGAPAGEASFLVEDYVPERLEVTLSPKTPALRAGQPAEIEVAARYLYGAPGAELDVSGEVVVQAAATPGIKGLEGFTVGLEDETVEAATAEIEEHGTTDAQGRVVMSVPVQKLAAPRPLEAKITLRVGEEGGRAVERSVTLPILPEGPVVGVRKNFGGDLAEGATATFDVVMVAPDGTRQARQGVAWNLYKVERRYQWFNSDGRWGFEPVKSTKRVADGRIDVSAAEPARIATPVEWGSYRLDVRVDGVESAQTSVSFTVGWGGDQTADVPDLLDMTLDKASYGLGDEIRARLSPRFAGKATLAVVSDKVHDLKVVDVAADGTTVTLPVKAEWGAGAYLVALAHRPLDAQAKRTPGRSLGLAWFEVDRSARTLKVEVAAPAQMRPRGEMRLPIKVAGLNPGEEARVTVAAVDVGILNLTRYKTPDPVEYFFGQKQLATELRDLYGYLIDGMQGTRGAIRSGGDDAGGVQGIPPVQDPLARYSGVVKVGPDGTAEVAFDIPAFNGTVRVMAVAWSATRVGSASADVIVRDPVVVTGTLPRFLSVGDLSRFHMQVANVEGPAADYTLDVDVHGPVVLPADALRKTFRLDAGAKSPVTIPVTAAGPGLAVVDVKLTGPNIAVSQSFRVAVQPGTSSLVRRTVRPLEAGASLTVSSDLLADILPGTGAVSVSVSPLAALDVPGLLQALDRYPYGCSEQIVSRALPLLYVNKLAATEALALDTQLDERVRDAIERVLARQDFERRLRPVVGRRGRHVAQRLCHRFPDPRARAQFRGAAARLRSRARALAQLRRQHDRGGIERRRSRLCGLCARPQRPAGDGRSALPRRHQDRGLQDAAVAGPDRRRARAPGRPRALAERVRRRGRAAARHARRRRLSRRLRHAPSRRRRHAGARLRGRPRARDDPADLARHRGGARVEPPDEHAGERLDDPRRRGARPRCRDDRDLGRRHAAQGLALPHLPPGDARARAGDACEHRRRRGAGRRQRHRQPDELRARGLERLRHRADLLQARRHSGRSGAGAPERPPRHRPQGDRGGGQDRARAPRRSPAGRIRDRQPEARRQRRGGGARMARDRGRAGPHRIPRRPLRRGVQPRHRPGGVLHGRLHGPGGRAGEIRPPAGRGGGHVPPRALRPHRLRHRRGDGGTAVNG